MEEIITVKSKFPLLKDEVDLIKELWKESPSLLPHETVKKGNKTEVIIFFN